MARAEATVAEATTPLLASCDTPADFVPRKQLLEENKKLKEQLSEFEKARVKEETDKKGEKKKNTCDRGTCICEDQQECQSQECRLVEDVNGMPRQRCRPRPLYRDDNGRMDLHHTKRVAGIRSILS